MTMVYPNLIAFKEALEVKGNQPLSNRKIALAANLNRNTVTRLIRGDISLLYLSTLTKLILYFQRQGFSVEIGDFFSWGDYEELLLNVGTLFQKLEATRNMTQLEIAQSTGIPILRLENLIRGNVKRVYLEDLSKLFVFFEEQGLTIEVGNLLRVEKEIGASAITDDSSGRPLGFPLKEVNSLNETVRSQQ